MKDFLSIIFIKELGFLAWSVTIPDFLGIWDGGLYLTIRIDV
jgi:hypothetical protein